MAVIGRCIQFAVQSPLSLGFESLFDIEGIYLGCVFPAGDREVHLLQKHELDVHDGVHWVWLTVLARRRPVFLFPFPAGKASPSFPWLSVC